MDTVTEIVAPLIPPTLGALVGLRYAVNQTAKARAYSWLLAVALGVYIGPALGEIFSLGTKTTVGCSFLVAMVGMEIVAMLIAAVRQVASDPAAYLQKIVESIASLWRK